MASCRMQSSGGKAGKVAAAVRPLVVGLGDMNFQG